MENTESRINNHEVRIRDLEISDAKMGEKIGALIENLNSLANWIKALVFLCGSSLAAFFVWYIQSL